MIKEVQRPGVREGYDAWSANYDRTPNPVVAMDRRHTMKILKPRPRERILDAGCGTGFHLGAMLQARSLPVGLDCSLGMLGVARRKFPHIPLAQASLGGRLPLRSGSFDAVLCALVGEHLSNLRLVFGEFASCLVAGGRLIFSVYHPEMAAAGIEANFEREGVEYRLGAFKHTVDDYLNSFDRSGFREVRLEEFCGDDALAEEIPSGKKYLAKPILIVIQGTKA